MQVDQAREEYVRWLLVTRDLSPHTVRAYNGDIAAFERHVGTSAIVGRIDRDCLLEFIEAQRAAGMSSTSMRRRASGLRGFCRWLLSRCLLASDPWAGVTVAVGRARKLPRVVPTSDLDFASSHGYGQRPGCRKRSTRRTFATGHKKRRRCSRWP